MAHAARSLLWCVIATAPLAGCVEEPEPDVHVVPPDLAYAPPGSGDKNTPYYNYYLDRRRDAAPWAPETTGDYSVSILSDFRFHPREASSHCVDLSGQPPVRVVGSYRDGAITIGADALVTVDGTERTMESGEEVDLAAYLVNSAGRRDPVTLHLIRGRSLAMPETEWLQWPVFAFTVTAEESCAVIAQAVVQFGPGWRMPEVATERPSVDPDGFGAFATVYRRELTALVAKIELYGGVPSAIAEQPDLGLLTACGGPSVASHAAMFDSLAAFGDGAWSHLPGDGAEHPVQFFLTEEGFPVVLHAGAAVDGALRELCWGEAFTTEHAGQPLPRLALPGEDDFRFDAVHAWGLALAAGEHATALPTAIMRGTETMRVDAFLHGAEPQAGSIVEQVATDVARTWIGEVQGALPSWSAARELLRTRVAQVTVAAPQQPMGFVVVATGDPFEYAAPPVVDDGWCIHGESACDPDLGFPRDPGSCVFDGLCEFGASRGYGAHTDTAATAGAGAALAF